MDIFLRNEDLDMTLIKTLQYSSSVAFKVAHNIWQLLFIRLPERERLQRIIIKITRPANNATGLAIDDFTVRPCLDFSKF